MRGLADRLNRGAGGDATHHGQFHRMDDLNRLCTGGRRGRGCIALDHARLKPLGGKRIRQFDDLNRAGLVCEAADEPAFLKRRDQTVDPRFRPQVERLFHLVERGRHTVLL